MVKDESKLSSVTGILVSLAAGSFLYISMLEILPTELAKPRCVCTCALYALVRKALHLLIYLFFQFVLCSADVDSFYRGLKWKLLLVYLGNTNNRTFCLLFFSCLWLRLGRNGFASCLDLIASGKK